MGVSGDPGHGPTVAGAPSGKVVVVDLRRGTLKTAAAVVAGPTNCKREWMQPTATGVLVGPSTDSLFTSRRHAAGDMLGQAVQMPSAGAGGPAARRRATATMGASSGGILVGRTTTTAPELFAVAIYDVGVPDAVRLETRANGVTHISAFGTVKCAAEFEALLEMSTCHPIKEGTAYPDVLLVHGMNDPRVDVWNRAKTAARLQAAGSSGKPALLRLDLQAGHGMGSTASQDDAQEADIQAFLLWQTGSLKLKE